MSEPLSREAFDLWRHEHDKKIDITVGFITAQTPINLATAERVAKLEAHQKEYTAKMIHRSTWISSIVAAIVGGLTGWFAK